LYCLGSDDSDDDDDDDDDDDPTLEHIDVSHIGGINRIRCMPQNSGVVATMSSSGQAHVYDLSEQLASMLRHGPRAPPPTQPTFSFSGHRDEGYALDWSPVASGHLLTGDCAGDIYAWNPLASNTWKVSSAYKGHTSSVEDLQWSPTEATVFSSASADKTVKIWDTRGKTGPQISVNAHDDDINVLSWNHNVNYLLATGCDDGSFKVWDLRIIRQAQPLANFRFHRGPITSIEWAPHDESMITLSSADNQVSIWDLSVESDDPDVSSNVTPGLEDYPPQLMFIHQGQENIKEIHHHPQIPGLILSTAEDSFNVFKPSITIGSN
jgi:ribosome assembly protein RRB1